MCITAEAIIGLNLHVSFLFEVLKGANSNNPQVNFNDVDCIT